MAINLKTLLTSVDFRTRVKTGSTLVFVLALILLFAAFTCFGRALLGLWCLGAVILAVYECAQFARRSSFRQEKFSFGYILTTILPVMLTCFVLWSHGLCSTDPMSGDFLLATVFICLASLGFAILYILSQGRYSLESTTQSMAEIIPALILIGWGGSACLVLALGLNSVSPILWLVAVVCLNDTAAYLVGCRYGGVKIAPYISPSKTIVGSLAGLFVGVCVGLVLGLALNLPGNWRGLILLSFLATLSAQVGDLLKSFLKRLYGIKDSGDFLPGHGGVLDRIDGVLAGAIVVWLWYIGHALWVGA